MISWERIDPGAPSDRADFVIAWIKRLVDPKSKQIKNTLHTKKGMCCLGIACDVAKCEWHFDNLNGEYYIEDLSTGYTYTARLPTDLMNFLKIHSSEARVDNSNIPSLVQLNDSHSRSFRFIAKIIQDNCKHIFEDLSVEEANYIKAFKIPTRDEMRALSKGV